MTTGGWRWTKPPSGRATEPHNFLDRGEGRIAFETVGEGPLIVCVPGMGELRSSYRYTAPALAGEASRWR